MHMADALISPAVGCTIWAASAGLIYYCSKRAKEELDEKKIPLMGVLGAFIFAAQMINFSIPGTGSSGHLGGAMILSILLGPYAAFLTMSSILTVQALFFADGGLLALGCNIFNLGFFPCFIAYPFIYKKIVGNNPTHGRILSGATLAAVVGLQLGALGVVIETVLSGISELPFLTFILLMQPIHLAIGIIEGLVTVAVVLFVWKARPEILERVEASESFGKLSVKNVVVGFLVAAVIIGGAISWFASGNPDGLEWAMFRTSGTEELEAPHTVLHTSLAKIQEKIAFMPDYDFKDNATETETVAEIEPATEPKSDESPSIVQTGTSVAGIIGGGLTLLMAALLGFVVKKRASSENV
ncbi:MAG: energy-coupling factor ABC transporter permease [bacterium]